MPTGRLDAGWPANISTPEDVEVQGGIQCRGLLIGARLEDVSDPAPPREIRDGPHLQSGQGPADKSGGSADADPADFPRRQAGALGKAAKQEGQRFPACRRRTGAVWIVSERIIEKNLVRDQRQAAGGTEAGDGALFLG